MRMSNCSGTLFLNKQRRRMRRVRTGIDVIPEVQKAKMEHSFSAWIGS
jgi:hypothetical protein